jgi:hypothetical protein
MKRAFGVAIAGLLILDGALRAFDVEAVIQKVDSDRRLVTFRSESRDRTVPVARDAKSLDATGKELAGGLTAKELKGGTAVTLTIQRDGDHPVITQATHQSRVREDSRTSAQGRHFKVNPVNGPWNKGIQRIPRGTLS